MLISRQLCIALLISFFWHLFWISGVSLVFLPTAVAPREYSPVYFLGSILKSPLFEQASLKDKPSLVELPPEACIQNQGTLSEPPYISPSVKQTFINKDFIDVDNGPRKRLSFAGSPLISAAAREREIIFQPPLPNYPEWAQQQEQASFVVFNIFISANGLVQEAVIVQTSGNPELDAALARYVRRWRFAWLSDAQGQRQDVKINLDFASSM